MFVRIVKMSFHEKHILDFTSLFNAKKEFIRKSEGCTLLELYQDKTNPEIFFYLFLLEKRKQFRKL